VEADNTVLTMTGPSYSNSLKYLINAKVLEDLSGNYKTHPREK